MLKKALLSVTVLLSTLSWLTPSPALASSIGSFSVDCDSPANPYAPGLFGAIGDTFTVLATGTQGACTISSSGITISGVQATPGVLAFTETLTATVMNPNPSLYLRAANNVQHVFSVSTGGAPPGAGPSPSSPSSQPVSLWRAALDPNGGVCVDQGVEQTGAWNKMFLGYGYLPGASDCSRPGYTLAGWADATSPDTVLSLPSLIDESDGKRRYFVANDMDVVAVWSAVGGAPSTPAIFVGSVGLFCENCGVFLLWTTSVDGSSVAVTDAEGTEVCAGSTVALGEWSLCHVPAGVAGTYSLVASREGVSGEPVTAVVA